MPSVRSVDEFVEVLAGEVAIGVGAAEDVEEGVFVPGLGAAGGDDLLHEDVDGLRRGFRAGRVRRRRILRTSAACSMRSSRVVAKKRPLGMAPRQWPARPTRCMATATARVVAIWQTRSTSPMSMPSSSEAVAMRILISPFLRRCSASRRRVRESEPWCAATCSGPRRSASSKAIFSTRRRVLTKTSVERWFWAWAASLSKISSHMAVVVTEPSSSEGTSMARSSWRRWPTWMMVAGLRCCVDCR